MKFQKIAFAAVLSAIGATVPAFAQTATTVPSGSMGSKPAVAVMEGAKPMDMYNASWVFRNLDAREVKRYRAKGFKDDDIKAAANIAMRAGVSTDYVLRLFLEGGYPLQQIAAMHGISTKVINNDIPGYGAETIMVQPKSGGMMNGSGSSMMMNGTGGRTGASSSPIMAGTAQGTIADLAMAEPSFSTLVSLVKAAGLADTLAGAGPYTVFAPTNAAFAKLPAGTVENLMKPENAAQLRTILTYHVLPGRVLASDVMAMTNPSMPRTVAGPTLNVKTTAPVMVNNASVLRADIMATNGVIHAIDTVLMPPTQ